MNALTAALYIKLSTDSTLISLLGTYRGSAAVFTGDLAPEDAAFPYIVIHAPHSQETPDFKDSNVLVIHQDIACYDTLQGSNKNLSTIAERVRTLLHNAVLTVTGYTDIITIAKGPIGTAREDHSTGYIIQLETHLF